MLEPLAVWTDAKNLKRMSGDLKSVLPTNGLQKILRRAFVQQDCPFAPNTGQLMAVTCMGEIKALAGIVWELRTFQHLMLHER